MGSVVNTIHLSLYPGDLYPLPLVQEAGEGGVTTDLDGAENIARIGIRFPDRPGCSASLYRPNHHGPPN
jgi:hypothetical protein